MGIKSHQTLSPEEEAKKLEQDSRAAAAAGDIATMLSLMVQASSQTTEDYVSKLIGGIRFMYYSYVDKFHTRPIDMTDLIDGMLYMDAVGYIEKKEREKIRNGVRNNG